MRLNFSSPRGLGEIRILALTGCTPNVTCPRTQRISSNLIGAWVRPTCSVGPEQGDLLLEPGSDLPVVWGLSKGIYCYLMEWFFQESCMDVRVGTV